MSKEYHPPTLATLFARATALVGIVAAAACSSSSSSGAGGADSGTSQNGTQSDGGVLGSSRLDGASDTGPKCEGEVADGILGTWGITLMAGGDAPGGATVIPVKATYRFCGSTSAGTFRYTEDGLHYVGRNCHLTEERLGTFTYDGESLVLTMTSGFSAVRDCNISSYNHEDKAHPGTQTYKTAISGSELVIQDGSVSDGKPGSVYERE